MRHRSCVHGDKGEAGVVERASVFHGRQWLVTGSQCLQVVRKRLCMLDGPVCVQPKATCSRSQLRCDSVHG
jgi:hypothetical protein